MDGTAVKKEVRRNGSAWNLGVLVEVGGTLVSVGKATTVLLVRFEKGRMFCQNFPED